MCTGLQGGVTPPVWHRTLVVRQEQNRGGNLCDLGLPVVQWELLRALRAIACCGAFALCLCALHSAKGAARALLCSGLLLAVGGRSVRGAIEVVEAGKCTAEQGQ